MNKVGKILINSLRIKYFPMSTSYLRKWGLVAKWTAQGEEDADHVGSVGPTSRS